METSLPVELDFQREAENAMRTQAYFAKIPQLPLVVPDVVWAKQRILVMAYETGHRLDDLAYLDANGIDRDEVAATLARIFNEMIFGEGSPRSTATRTAATSPSGARASRRRGHNFDIILYDHGLYRDIPTDLRRSYAQDVAGRHRRRPWAA